MTAATTASGARGDVGARRAPVALALGARRARCSLRLPFLGLPLTADEGGYAEIARLWEHGTASTAELFVDRPQGLLLVYRVLLDLGADSTVALRAAAAGVGVATVLALAFFAARVGGRIDGQSPRLATRNRRSLAVRRVVHALGRAARVVRGGARAVAFTGGSCATERSAGSPLAGRALRVAR